MSLTRIIVILLLYYIIMNTTTAADGKKILRMKSIHPWYAQRFILQLCVRSYIIILYPVLAFCNLYIFFFIIRSSKPVAPRPHTNNIVVIVNLLSIIKYIQIACSFSNKKNNVIHYNINKSGDPRNLKRTRRYNDGRAFLLKKHRLCITYFYFDSIRLAAIAHNIRFKRFFLIYR